MQCLNLNEEKPILVHWASLGKPKWVWPSIIRCRMFYAQTSTPHPSMHRILTEHGRWCMQNNQLPTKSHVELEDNSNLSVIIILPKVGTPGLLRSGGMDSGFCVRSCSNREFKTRSCFSMLPVYALLNLSSTVHLPSPWSIARNHCTSSSLLTYPWLQGNSCFSSWCNQ